MQRTHPCNIDRLTDRLNCWTVRQPVWWREGVWVRRAGGGRRFIARDYRGHVACSAPLHSPDVSPCSLYCPEAISQLRVGV